MAVKDLINCGVHEGRTGEVCVCVWGGEAQRDVAEKREKKTPEPKVRKKEKEKENKRVMRKKVVGSVCYGGSGALVFTA